MVYMHKKYAKCAVGHLLEKNEWLIKWHSYIYFMWGKKDTTTTLMKNLIENSKGYTITC